MTVVAKACRIITEERIVKVAERARVYHVQGDTGEYVTVLYTDPETRATRCSCTCRATVESCSHALAARSMEITV